MNDAMTDAAATADRLATSPTDGCGNADMKPRTKLVFYDSSDDENNRDGDENGQDDSSKGPHAVVAVDSAYDLTHNEADLVDEVELANRGQLDDPASADGAFFEAVCPTAFVEGDDDDAAGSGAPGGVKAVRSRVVEASSNGLSTGRGGAPKRDLSAAGRTTRKRFRDDDHDDVNPATNSAVDPAENGEEDGERGAVDAVEEPGHVSVDGDVRVVDGYRLSLAEDDVQDVFLDEEGDEEEDEEEDELDDITVVAAIEQLINVCEAEIAAAEETKDEGDSAQADPQTDATSTVAASSAPVEEALSEPTGNVAGTVGGPADGEDALVEHSARCEPSTDGQATSDKGDNAPATAEKKSAASAYALRGYGNFVAKAREQLQRLYSGDIQIRDFGDIMEDDVRRLRRAFASVMRPPKDAPIVVNGVVMDM